MNARDALIAAQDYVRQFRYKPEGVEHWDTLKELEGNLSGDCDAFAVAAIQKAWELANDPSVKFRLVIGRMDGGNRGHAWVEMNDGKETLWADPTPGYPPGAMPPSWWSSRIPLWGYEYDGTTFPTKVKYEAEN